MTLDISCYSKTFYGMLSWCSFEVQVQQMEAELRDYCNSFNKSDIGLQCPVLHHGRRVEGEKRREEELCAAHSSSVRPSVTCSLCYCCS